MKTTVSKSSRNSTSKSTHAEIANSVKRPHPRDASPFPYFFQPLDKKSFEPLYAQIQSQLREQIRQRKLGVDEPLPGEAELSRIFGVSRMTSRQALQGLTNEGLTYRERGRGTFVAAAKVEKQIAHLQGFSAEMRLLGLTASTRVLEVGIMSATAQVAASLGLASSAEVLYLHRLRLADGEPIAIEEAWVPYTRFPQIEKIDFGRRSLYTTLRERYGITIGSAQEVIEARGATRHEAKLLHVPAQSSLLVVSRTLLDAEGHPVETAYSLYRGDRYRAVLSIPAIQSSQSGFREQLFEVDKIRRPLPN